MPGSETTPAGNDPAAPAAEETDPMKAMQDALKKSAKPTQ
jgi:hypothetical protein